MNKVLILFLFVTLLGCSKNEKNEVQEDSKSSDLIIITKEQFKNQNMSLGSIEKQSFKSTIKVNGLIEVPPNNKVVVSSYLGGVIQEIPLIVGTEVKKGQFIVRLSNPEFIQLQQEYLKSKAELKFAEADFKRKEVLYAEKVVSKKEFLTSERNYKSLLATHEGVKQHLMLLNMNLKRVEDGEFTSSINLYAPISGNISEVHVNKGSHVSSSDKILEIVNTDHIHIELKIFEKDLHKIKQGQKILFKIPEVSDRTYEAKVHLVGNTIHKDRTVTVHAHMEDDNHNFVAGMFVESYIISSEKQSYAVPNRSIIKENGLDYILILKEESESSYQFKKSKVSVGARNETYSEITNSEGFLKQKFLSNTNFVF